MMFWAGVFDAVARGKQVRLERGLEAADRVEGPRERPARVDDARGLDEQHQLEQPLAEAVVDKRDREHRRGDLRRQLGDVDDTLNSESSRRTVGENVSVPESAPRKRSASAGPKQEDASCCWATLTTKIAAMKPSQHPLVEEHHAPVAAWGEDALTADLALISDDGVRASASAETWRPSAQAMMKRKSTVMRTVAYPGSLFQPAPSLAPVCWSASPLTRTTPEKSTAETESRHLA